MSTFDIATIQVTTVTPTFFLVLIEGLSFANGLTLSPQEDYLLVVESAKQAVWKYHLAGENEGQKEFFSKMPGIPDNITPSGGDGYLIGITFPTTTSGLDKILHHIRSFHPLVRLTVRLIRLIQLSFQFINQFVIKTELTEMLGMKKISISSCNIHSLIKIQLSRAKQFF